MIFKVTTEEVFHGTYFVSAANKEGAVAKVRKKEIPIHETNWIRQNEPEDWCVSRGDDIGEPLNAKEDEDDG